MNSDGLFGPTLNNRFYKAVHYHNKSSTFSSNKTRWVLKKNEQYEVFRVSDANDWMCNNTRGLFSILNNGAIILGENEERLSFFPEPSNVSDAWHGYPVNSCECEPSIALVDKWLEENIIDERIHIKILKGQL